MKHSLDLQRVQKNKTSSLSTRNIGIITWLPELYSNKRFLEASQELNISLSFLTPEQVPLEKQEGIYFLRLGEYKYMNSLEKLKDLKHHYINSLETFSLYRNKISTLKIWSQNDIPFPDSLILDTYSNTIKDLQDSILASVQNKNPAEIFQIIQNFLETGSVPFIIKHPTSLKGKGVFLIKTAEYLTELLSSENFRTSNQWLLQKFYEESSGEDFRALHIDKDIFSIQRKNLHSFKSNLHQGGLPTEYRLSPEEKEFCQRVFHLSKLNYGGLDFIKTQTGIKFLEMNVSPGFEGVERACQIDIAKRILQLAF